MRRLTLGLKLFGMYFLLNAMVTALVIKDFTIHNIMMGLGVDLFLSTLFTLGTYVYAFFGAKK